MKKADRKGHRTSSSARAAELVGGTGGLAAGFGGYSGSKQLPGAGASATWTPSPTSHAGPPPAQLNGEIGQYLKHLSKKDATTKLKALQALNKLFLSSEKGDVVAAIPHWTYAYRRLVMDFNPSVRAQANEALGQLVLRVKRELAPHLKLLMGSWWLSQHDVHKEVARAAKTTFEAAFSEQKRKEAVLMYHQELLKYLEENLMADLRTLGDPQSGSMKKGDLEDLEIRYEGVVCASLSSLLSLVDASMGEPSETPILEHVASLVSGKPFFKKHLGAKSASVRLRAYQLVDGTLAQSPKSLAVYAKEMSPRVVGAVGEKEPSCHGVMWSMVLRFIKACPQCWEHLNMDKAILPRLSAFLRHGGYGSCKESYPAVLPFVSSVPKGLWGNKPALLVKIMESAWQGMQQPSREENCDLSLAVQNALLDSIVDELVVILETDLHSAAGSHLDLQRFRRVSQVVVKLASAQSMCSADTKIEIASRIAAIIGGKLAGAVVEGSRNAEVVAALVDLVKVYGPGIVVPSEIDAMDSWQVSSPPNFFQQLVHICTAGNLPGDTVAAYGELVLACVELGDHTSQNSWGHVLQQIVRCNANDGVDSPQPLVGSCVKQLPQFACILIEMLTAGKIDFRGPLEVWQCPELDALALSCCQESALASSQECVELARLLLGSHKSLLTPQTSARMMTLFLDMLEACLTQRGAENVPDLGVCTTIIGILDDTLFSGLLPDGDEALELWWQLVCCVAHLAWQHSDQFGQASKEVINQMSDLSAAASKLWASGTPLRMLHGKIPVQIYRAVEKLTGLLKHQLQIMCKTPSLVPCDHDAIEAIAVHASELLSACSDPTQRARLLDTLLLCHARWPQWCQPGGEAGALLPTEEHEQGGICSMVMLEFCCHLLRKAGVEDVLGGLGEGSAEQRAWLAVELLCSPKGEDTCAGGAEDVLDHLVVSAVATAAAAEEEALSSQEVAEGKLHSLPLRVLDYCLAMGLQTAQPFVGALHDSLMVLAQHATEHGVVEVLSNFFRGCVFGITPSDSSAYVEEVLITVLSTVGPCFRAQSEQIVKSSGLADFSRIWLEAACSSNLFSPSSPDCQARWPLRVALACFPVDSNGEHVGVQSAVYKGYALPHERDSLLELFRRQAGTCQAAERKSQLNECERVGVDESLAQLGLRVVAYCSEQLGTDDWRWLMDRTKAGIGTIVTKLEECVESLSASVVTCAAEASEHEVETPAMGLELLGQLSRVGIVPQDNAVAKAVQEMELCALTSMCSNQSPWAQTLAILLHPTMEGIGRLSADKWRAEMRVRDILLDCMRCTFCAGSILSLAHAGGEAAWSNAGDLLERMDLLWNAMSRLVDTAQADEGIMAEALEAMDAWADDTGVDPARCLLALALLPHRLDSLRMAAFRMAASEQAISQLTMATALNEDTTEEMEEGDDVQLLVDAGIHTCLAPTLTRPDQTGLFLCAWSLMLVHLIGLSSSSQRRHRLTQALQKPTSLVSVLLDKLAPLLPLQRAGQKQKYKRTNSAAELLKMRDGQLQLLIRRIGAPNTDEDWQALAVQMYHIVLIVFPASARTWFGDVRDKALAMAVKAYTEEQESPALIQREFDFVQSAAASADDTFKTRCVPGRGEVIATMEIEETSMLELVIKLPSCTPLKPAEVECQNKVGVNDTQLRKWLLSIAAFMWHQNGSLLEAVSLWKQNVDRAFQGVEPCLICYSVVHPSNRETPRLRCATCSVQFHGACLYRWFRQSGKSQCPHCQSPWTVGSQSHDRQQR
eukprot:evm.model.scf_804.2 EVM.evm.TU.scf_804.2   scf_804:8274-25915(+)